MENTTLPETAQRVANLLAKRGHDKLVVMLPQTGKTSADADDAQKRTIWRAIHLRPRLDNSVSAVSPVCAQ